MTKDEYLDSVRQCLKRAERSTGGSLRSEAFRAMDILRELITEVDEGRIP